jgi:hypothetical protein
MKQTWAHRNFLTRKFAAAIVLCLFVMKGLSFMGMAASLGSDPFTHNDYAESVVLGMHCDKANNNSDHAGHHIDHSECCVFCSSASRDVTVVDVYFSKVVAVLSPKKEQTILPFVYADRENDAARPFTWRDSWNSTAPPRG